MSDDLFSRYPNLRGKPAAMAAFCSVLRDNGRHADAFALGRAATAMAPNDMAVRDEVLMALSLGVDRFHIPMLNDHVRNRIYARAIEQRVRPGMKVLEIGTGAGLLALLAARAGAEVTTCEANPTVAAAATHIVAQNGFADRIKVVPKRSTAVRIPEDMSEPADMIIHEIFGAMMVDEGVVDALSDARARLLKPGAPALPPKSWVRCVLACAGDKPFRQDDVAMVEGFDLSAFNLLGHRIRRSMSAGSKAIDRRSAPGSALTLDFDTPPPFGARTETISLVSQGGRLDGIVQWLALDFGDGDLLENDPFAGGAESSWAAPFFPFTAPMRTEPGDVIDVTLRHRRLMLTVDAVKR